jgi:DNA-binding NtrC family response regulator
MNKNLIFLVDDDVFYLELLKSYLIKYQHPIELYSNGSDCVDNLYKTPTIIILDFNFNDPSSPYPDGSKIFLEIKKRSPKTKVIILSNQESGDTVLQLMQIGIKDYIEKNENVFKKLDQIFESMNIY